MLSVLPLHIPVVAVDAVSAQLEADALRLHVCVTHMQDLKVSLPVLWVRQCNGRQAKKFTVICLSH